MQFQLPPLLPFVQIIDRHGAEDSEQKHHAFGVWLLIRKNDSMRIRQPVENGVGNIRQTGFTVETPRTAKGCYG